MANTKQKGHKNCACSGFAFAYCVVPKYPTHSIKMEGTPNTRSQALYPDLNNSGTEREKLNGARSTQDHYLKGRRLETERIGSYQLKIKDPST